MCLCFKILKSSGNVHVPLPIRRHNYVAPIALGPFGCNLDPLPHRCTSAYCHCQCQAYCFVVALAVAVVVDFLYS